MPSACDELEAFDRLTLREAVERGEVKVVLVREGRPNPDLAPVRRRMDRMAACGFLERTSLGGSKARMTGAEYFACYIATQAGRVAIEAIDRAERAEARLRELGEDPPRAPRPGRSRSAARPGRAPG